MSGNEASDHVADGAGVIQKGPNTAKNDLEYCNSCGQSGDPANHGYYVDVNDVGEDAEGETARLFREDAEKYGEWRGFKEEDVGYWCYSCSWAIQRKRTQNSRLNTGDKQ